MNLRQDRRYSVTRVYADTASCFEGREYTIQWHNERWAIIESGVKIYSAHASTFNNRKFWTINYCLDEDSLQGQYEQEYSMSFDKVNTEALEIKENATLVNGQDVDKLSDNQLEAMAVAELKKLAGYKETCKGLKGKFFDKKQATMARNIALLETILDKRVDS